jgi:Cell wall-active antibiotics response 4TMS YvqF
MARPTGRVEGRIVGVAFLGEARIDLTYASLDENGVEITAQAVIGTVHIVVPRDARVTMTGFPLLGELSPTREPGPADGPPVKVSAFALLGSVTIHRAEVKEGDG